MGKRMNESRQRLFDSRAYSQTRAQLLNDEETPTPVIDEPVLPVAKTMANCGNEQCCRYMAAPALLDGRSYNFDRSALSTMPMACGGDLWKPRPENPRVKARPTGAPLGLVQFRPKP